MASKEVLQQWMDLIDGAAEAANSQMRQFTEEADALDKAGGSSGVSLQVRALHLIAVQIAYSNTLAAGEFYMTWVAERTIDRAAP